MKLVKDSEVGVCPRCESTNLDYKAIELDGDNIYYPVVCDECDQEFREYHSLKFNGNYIEQTGIPEAELTHEEAFDKIQDELVELGLVDGDTTYIDEVFYQKRGKYDHYVSFVGYNTAAITIYKTCTKRFHSSYNQRLDELPVKILVNILKALTI